MGEGLAGPYFCHISSAKHELHRVVLSSCLGQGPHQHSPSLINTCTGEYHPIARTQSTAAPAPKTRLRQTGRRPGSTRSVWGIAFTAWFSPPITIKNLLAKANTTPIPRNIGQRLARLVKRLINGHLPEIRHSFGSLSRLWWRGPH